MSTKYRAAFAAKPANGSAEPLHPIVLADLLRVLRRHGLTFQTCIEVFGQPARKRHQKFVDAALPVTVAGQVEVVYPPIVVPKGKSASVLAWIEVEDPDRAGFL